MKHYGLYQVTYDRTKKDKHECIIRFLRGWFIDNNRWEIPFIKASTTDTDQAWLNARKADFNMRQRREDARSFSHRFKTVWFIHECDEQGYWKLTKGEQKAITTVAE